MPQEKDIIWTVNEAAAFLRLRKNTIYELISKKKIPHLRFGKSIRLSKTDVLAYGSSVSVASSKD